MKIIHCCFGNEHYIDTWGYQQNLLPLYHAKMGLDTVVVASSDTYPNFVNSQIVEEIKKKGLSYFNGPVRVERTSSYFSRYIHFQKAKRLFLILSQEEPDVIFFHGSLNLSILSCVAYKKKHPQIRLFVDNHGDEYNINNNRLYRLLFFKFLWSIIHKYCQKYVDMYYGVTCGRCDFLKQYFNINPLKVKLLPIGADIDAVKTITLENEDLRKKYGLNTEDIIIVHGGKLDERKGTTNLIKACKTIREEVNPHIKLLLFGEIVDPKIKPLIDEFVCYNGWLTRTQTLEVLLLADLAVWPIHHTTLIEDCVAAGLPYLIRKTETTRHLINSDFYLKNGSIEELCFQINYFLSCDRDLFKNKIKLIKEQINYYNVAKSIL